MKLSTNFYEVIKNEMKKKAAVLEETGTEDATGTIYLISSRDVEKVNEFIKQEGIGARYDLSEMAGFSGFSFFDKKSANKFKSFLTENQIPFIFN